MRFVCVPHGRDASVLTGECKLHRGREYLAPSPSTHRAQDHNYRPRPRGAQARGEGTQSDPNEDGTGHRWLTIIQIYTTKTRRAICSVLHLSIEGYSREARPWTEH